MTYRISSLPPRGQDIDSRNLVASQPESRTAAGSAASAISQSAEAKPPQDATIVDLSSRAAASAAVAEANTAAASRKPKDFTAPDMSRVVANLQKLSATDPNRLLRAQGAPDASRALSLLSGS